MPLSQLFFCEFCEISKNTFFTVHLWATASAMFWNSSYYKGNIHCVKGVRIQGFSGPYFPEFGLNTETDSANLRVQVNSIQALPAALFKKRLWHRCFPVNLAKFLRIPFLQITSWRLLLIIFIQIFGKIQIICKWIFESTIWSSSAPD